MAFRSGIQARLGLWGLGGIGKTQIAIEYAYTVKESAADLSIFWIRAANRDRFEESYMDLAKKLGIEAPQGDAADRMQLIADYLQNWTDGRWLMIVDNADEIEHFKSASRLSDQGMSVVPGLERYIPSCDHGSVLITSRVQQVCIELAGMSSHIHIDKMDMKDCKLLLGDYSADEGSENAASCLVVALEHLPLALRQARGFMAMNPMDFETYLRLYSESEASRLELLCDEEGAEDKDGVQNGIMGTWLMSFSQIKANHPVAASLLSFMGFVDLHDIPKSLLPHDPKTVSSVTFEKAIGKLKGYSMISSGSNAESYNIHGLVQLSMRRWLMMNGERDECISEVVDELAKKFPPDSEHQHWSLCARYLPHIQTASRYLPQLSEHDDECEKEGALKRPGISDCEAPEGSLGKVMRRNEVDLLMRAAGYLRTQGRWSEAEDLLLISLNRAKAILGLENVLTIRNMEILAMTYYELGRLDEAERLQTETLKKHIDLSGTESREALSSMDNLAMIYIRSGRVEKAKAIELEVLGVRNRSKEGCLNDYSTIWNLADIHRELGELEEAEELFYDVYSGVEDQHGLQHPETLNCAERIAWVYLARGNLGEAEWAFIRIDEERKKIYGEDHPARLLGLSRLVETYEKNGKWDEAELLSRELYDKCRKTFGENRDLTIWARKAFERLERPRSWWRDTPQQEIRSILEDLPNVTHMEPRSTDKQLASPNVIDVDDIYNDPVVNETSRVDTVHRYACAGGV
jgi:tetratricopeptide (TPR) repeat protein